MWRFFFERSVTQSARREHARGQALRERATAPVHERTPECAHIHARG
jgi:hypothetical protein